MDVHRALSALTIGATPESPPIAPLPPVFFDVLDDGNRLAFSRRLPRVDFKTEVNRFLGNSQCG